MIIPTLNPGKNLKQLLQSLSQQSKKPVEIMVIDSGTADQSLQCATQNRARVIKIAPATFDHGGTRNHAAAMAEGEILVFMTQDAMPYDHYTLERLVAPLNSEQIVVSYARQLAPEQAPAADRYLRQANYPARSVIKAADLIPDMGIRTFQNSNVCAAYRRKEFEALNCFPSPVVCNEDMLFAARAIFAGYKVAYCAEAVVWHSHSYTPVELFKRYFDIAASLDHEPRLLSLGQTGKAGLNYLRGYLTFLRQNKKLYLLPVALLETICRYTGFKLGRSSSRLPRAFNIKLGLNRCYWSETPI